jgi:diguanylate cyclase (GGDEF)-like protein
MSRFTTGATGFGVLAGTGPALGAAWAVHALVLRRRLSASRQETAAARAQAEAAHRDPLTGLWTRTAWTVRAEQLLQDPRAVVVLADLDRFKEVNDAEGHAAGDQVLVAVAARLRAWTATHHGTAGRIGGDEFVAVVLLNQSEVEVQVGALRTACRVPVRGVQALVSASIGAARAGEHPEEGLPELLRRADEAMYATKRADRHGSVLAVLPLFGRRVNGRRPGRRGTSLTTQRRGVAA